MKTSLTMLSATILALTLGSLPTWAKNAPPPPAPIKEQPKRAYTLPSCQATCKNGYEKTYVMILGGGGMFCECQPK